MSPGIPARGPQIERFEGRVALVTGGGSGIGLGIVRALSGAGATVVVADRDESAAKPAAAEINGHADVVDVTDVAAVDAPTTAGVLALSDSLRAELLPPVGSASPPRTSCPQAWAGR